MKKRDSKNNLELIRNGLDTIQNRKGDGELYFLIVGVNNYLHEKKLLHPRGESESFLSIFKEHCAVRQNNIYSLYNEDATKVNILYQLDKIHQTLRSKDRLVIYFSGHGHNENSNNFFIPYDGVHKRIVSCIPNSYIFDTVKEFHFKSTLLFFDLKFHRSVARELDFKYKLSSFLTDGNEISTRSLCSEVFDFWAKIDVDRIKQSFFIYRDSNNNTEGVDASNSLAMNRLLKVSNDLRANLSKLAEENKVYLLLKTLLEILDNNDRDLLSRAETLYYKLNQINVARKSNLISNKDYKEDRDFILADSESMIEAINEKGFFLVRTSAKSKKIGKSKKRIPIVFTSANPRDQSLLRLNNEEKEIEYELMKARYRERFEFIPIKAARTVDLQDALLNHSPKFVHFSGHGNCDGIALLDDDDKTMLVKTNPIAKLFELFSDDVHCVFLNSCYSMSQSKEINKYIRKVICMSGGVPDNVAIKFASAFYKSIGAGRDIDFSFKFARNAIELDNLAGHDIPVVLSRD